jgi:hypothetical protein
METGAAKRSRWPGAEDGMPVVSRAHVGIAIGAGVVAALAMPLGLALSGLAPDAVSSSVVFYAVVISCFFGVGLAVRVLAPVRDAWFAMFVGAFGGGVVWASAMLLTSPQGAMSLVALVVGGVSGAWAAGTFGSVGFACGTFFLRLARRRSPRKL